VSGVAHFAAPRPYDTIVPRALPGRARGWTYASGAVELAVAAALVLPKYRRLGGWAAAALFVGVFPANVQMALDWRTRPLPLRAAAYARLPLQIPLVVSALRVARDAGRTGGPSGARER
jgi:uncharacterized membrane protein